MKLSNIIAGLFVAVFMMAGAAWAGNSTEVNTTSMKQSQSAGDTGEKTTAHREGHGTFKNMEELVKKKLAKIEDGLESDDTDEGHGKHKDK